MGADIQPEEIVIDFYKHFQVCISWKRLLKTLDSFLEFLFLGESK